MICIAEKHRNGLWTGLSRQNAGARPLIDWSPAANDHGNVSERQGNSLGRDRKSDPQRLRERQCRGPGVSREGLSVGLCGARPRSPGQSRRDGGSRHQAPQGGAGKDRRDRIRIPAGGPRCRPRRLQTPPRRRKPARPPQAPRDRPAVDARQDRRRTVAGDRRRWPGAARASDAPRSRVLPVVPDIMPDATLPGAPAIDMADSAPRRGRDGSGARPR